MSSIDEMLEILGDLSESQIEVLFQIAVDMKESVKYDMYSDSELITDAFADKFGSILIAHHSRLSGKFKKRAFEHAFVEAASESGFEASLAGTSTSPSADIIVDGEEISLKTEASSNIKENKIHISKLLEAREIRGCHSRSDFRDLVRGKVVSHLSSYNRLFILRGFEGDDHYKYQLVEIPISLLLKVDDLDSSDFKEESDAGSSRAEIMEEEERLFSIVLDGSVEKVTISNLLVRKCIEHCNWKIYK